MLSIVVPSFNEKPNVEPLLAAIDKALANVAEYEVVFIDDSKDDTPALLEEISRRDPRVRYLHRENGGGLASAVVEGFGLAKGDVVAVMDADLQHPPELLAAMYGKIGEGADVVLPSRYLDGGGSGGLSFLRMLASKSARLAAQIFLKSMRNVTDPMSGYFMFRRSVIDGVALNPLGWKILMEVLVLGHYKTVVEIPYHFDKRFAGESKLSFKVTIQYFLHIVSLVMRSERDRRLFVFLMVGFSGMVIDMLLFWLITSHSSYSVNAAATMSASVGLVNNYLLNRNITWKSKKRDDMLSEFGSYALANGMGIGIKNIGVYIFVHSFGLSAGLGNFIGIVCGSVWNFVLNNTVVFREKKGGAEGG